MHAGRSSRRLARVPGLSADLHAAVRQSGLAKCSDLLTLTTLELVDRLDLYLEEVEDVLEAVAAAVAPQPRTVLQLLQSKAAGPRPLRTGLPALDSHLGGGLRAGGVTEVVGPACMGKTQLCLALAARALVDGSGSAARVLYVDNERSFQPARLVQLLRMLVSHGAPAVDPEELAARVCVVQPASWEEYEHCLPTLETEMLQQPASLIVVDSIAAPARAHFGRDRLMQRQASAAFLAHRSTPNATPAAPACGNPWPNPAAPPRPRPWQEALAAQAAYLKYLAEAYSAVVLVVNQVMGGGAPDGSDSGNTVSRVQGVDDSLLSACLGNTWAHCVNTRLVLQHASGGGGGLGGAARQTQLRVAKDPMCAEALFNYYIGSAGFMDLPLEYSEY